MAPGGEGGPLRPGDEKSLPYCAAQRNMDNVGIGGAPRGAGGAIRPYVAPARTAQVGADDDRARGGVAFDVGRPPGTENRRAGAAALAGGLLLLAAAVVLAVGTP